MVQKGLLSKKLEGEPFCLEKKSQKSCHFFANLLKIYIKPKLYKHYQDEITMKIQKVRFSN